MIETVAVVVNVVVFGGVLVGLARLGRGGRTLSAGVLLGVAAGVACGAALQGVYGLGSPIVQDMLEWVAIAGRGYVRLLQMIIAPLVLVSILAAVTRVQGARSLGAISAGVLAVLLLTTAISAFIGVEIARGSTSLARGPRRPSVSWCSPSSSASRRSARTPTPSCTRRRSRS